MFVFKKSFKITFLFLKRNIALVIIGIFLGIAFFLFRKHAISLLRKIFPPETRIGIIGKYNPNSLPDEITSLISFGLTKVSPNGNPLPGAAMSWETKKQGKQYLFHLNPLLHWQNRSPLLAKDISYQIEGVEIFPLNDYTIAFNLERPFSPLPILASAPLFKKRMIGLGDYQVKKLRLNANYVSSLLLESVSKNKQPQQVVFHFYPSEKELIMALKLGEVNCAYGLTSIEEVKQWTSLDISPQKKLNRRYVALFFNTEKEPFSNKRFRQALAYSLHKPEESIRTFTPISPLSWAYNPNVKTYPFDPDHSKKIISEASGEATISAELKIQITTTFELSDWGERIKLDWEKYLGIKTEVKILPFIPKGQDFDVILGYGIVPHDPDQYPFWHSQQPGNITKLSNPRIDKLLEEGRTVFNKEERKNIYQDFQRFLLEELPAIFLFYPTTYNVCQKGSPELN